MERVIEEGRGGGRREEGGGRREEGGGRREEGGGGKREGRSGCGRKGGMKRVAKGGIE